jgi:hypothetical protein
MGELENLQQNFEKAKEYYRKSYLLSPSPRVKEKLEKLSKEQLVESNLDTYDEEHFIIKYRRDDPKYEGSMLRDVLRDSYRTVSQDFGFYIHNKIVVLLYEGSEFRYVTNQQYYVGGLYDGKIRLPAYRKDMSSGQLRATVAHEMTHAFVAYLSGSKAPAWIQEGLAEYEENKIRPVELTALRRAVQKKQTLPIDQFFLLGITPDLKPEDLMLFYQQAFSFVSYFVERFGMYRMRELLEKFGKGEDSFAAIEEVLKISPQRLEKEWLETLK